MSFTKIEASGLDVGPLSGNRNKIINGDMTISQRGTSFVSPANATYNLDRFLWGQSGTMAVTITQSTDVPNNTFQNSLKVDVTTADTPLAAGDNSAIIQRIEGYNVRDLIGQTFTLSFWVKSPKTGVHCVSFRNSLNDRSYVTEYTVITANTWEYKTITVVGGLITTGTWDWTNSTGLSVRYDLGSGTTYQTTAGSWQVGNFHCTANQVNVMDNVANDFFLTGVQLEVGTVATPFERRPYGTELALCQRYYYESITNNTTRRRWAGSTAASYLAHELTFPVTMRATPNIGTDGNALTNCTALATVMVTPNAVAWTVTSSIAGGIFSASWDKTTADAEI
jgi:hypothetical protein